MAGFVTCTLVYTVNATGLTPAALAAKINAAAVPIPPEYFGTNGVIGGAITSDATVNNVRTIVWDLTPTSFTKNFLKNDAGMKAPFFNLMSYLIQNFVGSPVVASTPLLA